MKQGQDKKYVHQFADLTRFYTHNSFFASDWLDDSMEISIRIRIKIPLTDRFPTAIVFCYSHWFEWTKEKFPSLWHDKDPTLLHFSFFLLRMAIKCKNQLIEIVCLIEQSRARDTFPSQIDSSLSISYETQINIHSNKPQLIKWHARQHGVFQGHRTAILARQAN